MRENKTYKTGKIIKTVSGFYYVDDGENIFECKARGIFRQAKISPTVGDKVNFSDIGGAKGVLEEVMPRRNYLSRPSIANVDKIIIVSSFENPSPDTYMIDRLSAIAVYNDIVPVMVFNKSDTGDFTEYERIYKNAGFNTYVVSALQSGSLNILRKEFDNCICVMAGNSGVGKSSLINALFPGFGLKTGEVSTALGRGRHTTRHTELFKCAKTGFVADTPGFSSIKPNYDTDFKERLVECFPDILPYTDNCRFTSCTHTCEMGCGVIEALESGKIQKTRFESYVLLYGELKNAEHRYKSKGQ